jgi:hypothetical protein
MPPFLTVMGALYLVLIGPYLLAFVRAGYWHGMGAQLLRCIWRWRLALLFSSGIVLLAIRTLDLRVTSAVKAWDLTTHAYTFWDFICSCGEGGVVLGVLITLVLMADYFKWQRCAAIARISLMSSLYAGVANALLKCIFNRERPASTDNPWHFFAFFHSKQPAIDSLFYAYNSMPSGHVITTVAAVLPFYWLYQAKFTRSGLIAWVALVAFARIYTINHWFSDVLVAAIFGTLIAHSVYQLNFWRLNNVK